MKFDRRALSLDRRLIGHLTCTIVAGRRLASLRVCLRWLLGFPVVSSGSLNGDGTRGELRVDIAHRRVWLWDGEETHLGVGT